jgi:hypothetical protein
LALGFAASAGDLQTPRKTVLALTRGFGAEARAWPGRKLRRG